MPKNMIHESWCSNKPHLLHVTKYILSHSELFATFFAVHPDILFKIVFWLLSEMSDLVKVACLWSPCCSSHLPFHWSTGALWKVHHMIQEKLLPVLIKNLNPTCKPFSCPFSRSWSQGPFSAQLSQISPQRCIQHLLLQPCLPLWPSNRNTLEMVRIPGTNKLSTRDSCAIEKQNPTSHGFHNEDSPSCALCRLANPAIIFSQHRKTDLNECWESLEATCRMSLWSHWGRCQHPRRDRCLQCAIGVILHAFKYHYLCMWDDVKWWWW